MASIEMKHVNCSYDGGKTYALRDININLEREGRYSLLGPSGCGKTTLLKIIAGLLPYEGDLYFDGANMWEVPIEKRNIAMVFQSPVVYPMSVSDNLMFPLRRESMSQQDRLRKVRSISEMLELDPVLNQPANKLGAADMQTVALGRALIKNAKIILLDEPLTNIEAEKRLVLRTKIKLIQEEEKKIFIYVTHDQTEALTLSDKIAVMKDGELIQFGTKDDIYDRPSHTFVGYFMGSPGMNMIDGEWKDQKMNFKDFDLPVPPRYKNYFERISSFKLGIRPECLNISKTEHPDHVSFNCVDIQERGEGLRIVYLQSSSRQNKLCAVGQFPKISAGDDVWVKFLEDKIIMYDKDSEKIVQ